MRYFKCLIVLACFTSGHAFGQDRGYGDQVCLDEASLTVAKVANAPQLWSLRGASTIDVTDREGGELGTAFYEITWWQANDPDQPAPMIQCRSLFRDQSGSLQMTSSRCFMPIDNREYCE